jgi:tRNA (guanine-N7-)-methyltransferase
MKKSQVWHDETSFGYLIKTLCEGLKIDEAWKIIKEMNGQHLDHSPALSAIATSCALVGDFEGCKRAIEQAEHVMLKDTERMGGNGNNKLKSIPMFLKLRNEEVEREIARVRKYMEDTKRDASMRDSITQFGTFLESSRVLFSSCNQLDQKIDLEQMFQNKKSKKLEICSGLGDWVVDKAYHDRESDWVSLEMRHERVFQIWSRMTFSNLDNMLILCGEAHATLDKSIQDKAFDEVYINYPDPPFWEGSKQRLIDEQFLKHVHRVIKPGGSLIIVTDNTGYKEIMVNELKQLKKMFESAYGRDTPYTTTIPEDYGISSYFDRFWKNGNKSERFYLKYKRL